MMTIPFEFFGRRLRSWFTARTRRPIRKQERRWRPLLDVLEDRTLPSATPALGTVFYIEMENHNLTQPTGLTTTPEQLLGNPAAPYLNSLMTPGNPNAAQTSYASAYYNVEYNNPSVSIHPSEPNYVWQEAGLAGPLNDADPYANTPNNIVNAPNLTALLQNAGVSWKSYQEDIDLTATSGPVNQPGPNSLTSTVAPQDQWTVPLKSFSGTSASYTNPYNGSQQYNYAVKHDGQLFFTATNGSTSTVPNFSPSNPEAPYYAPLQQLQSDLDNNTVSQYTLITPDQYNDMHSSLNTNFTYKGVTYNHNTDQESIAMGDNFLSIVVPEIMASAAYKNNGAIVIWFDETEGGNSTSYTIPEVVISPLAKGNAYDSTVPYTHSSDLKSMQELFGVSAPGGGFLGDANSSTTNDIWDMFKFSPTITSTASPGVAVLSPKGVTLTDAAVLANGSGETGNLVFTLTGPNGFSATQSDPLTGNGSFSASVTLPASAAPGDYTWSVSYAGDANNLAAVDQGGSAEQTVVVGPGATLVDGALYLVGGDSNDQLTVTPAGVSSTGSTGVTVNGKLGNIAVNDQTFTGVSMIYVSGFGGNDNFQFAPSLATATVVTDGDGNDQIQLGNGANTVTVGVGNDVIQAGDGANTITAGADRSSGNIQVLLGNGLANLVKLYGDGNDQVQIGNGDGATVSISGNGNDHVTLGDGASDSVTILGNGNDHVQLGNGNKDSVAIAGNGNDHVQLGNGLDDFLSLLGNGNDDVQTGGGSGQAHLSGSGHKTVRLGGGWQRI